MKSTPTIRPSLLRRMAATLRGLVSIEGVASDPKVRREIASPRIRQALEDLCDCIRRDGGTVSDRAGCEHALSYRIRPRFEVRRVRPGFDSVEVPPIMRFQVVDADPELLTCLGRVAVGFHVFELSCAGLERHWRDDLAKVLETRCPIAGRLTVFVNADHAELEHIALPVIDAGRVVAIRGWFDQIDGTGVSVSQIEWTNIRQVRRAERSRPFDLPARFIRPESGGSESEVQRQALHATNPCIPRRSAR